MQQRVRAIVFGVLGVCLVGSAWSVFAVARQRRLDASLVEAARHGDVAGARAALREGAHADAAAHSADYTFWAAMQERWSRGPRTRGVTALAQAAIGGHIDVARVLVDAGADVNVREVECEDCGPTVLMFAAKYGHADVAELLIQRGAKVNVTTWGSSTLDLAADPQVAAVLRRAGAKPGLQIPRPRSQDGTFGQSRQR